jgi:hypothetical protein
MSEHKEKSPHIIFVQRIGILRYPRINAAIDDMHINEQIYHLIMGDHLNFLIMTPASSQDEGY